MSTEAAARLVCPELAGSPSLQAYIGMALPLTGRGFFGELYWQALALRAAHLHAVFEGGGRGAAASVADLGGGAPVASASEGGLSVSFAQGAADAGDLNRTKYGRMLAALIKGRPSMGMNGA